VIGRATILRANARSLPLADDSVDLVVTSPPYFALRSYQDGGEHYAGQIGAEPTPGEFVDALLDVTRECMRVLKPSGSLWVNLGDKYAANQGAQGGTGGRADRAQAATYEQRPTVVGFRPKTLLGIPWRYAIRCVDELGLILRAEIIWSKPNGLPESVTDRVRRSHEQWFHFSLNPRYFSAVDEIREPHTPHMIRYSGRSGGTGRDPSQSPRLATAEAHPLGKLPGSVWEIPTEPLNVPAHLGVDHFAAFPTEWPRRIIQGWSPSGICTECGEGRRPVVYRATLGHDNNPRRGVNGGDKDRWVALKAADPDRITGYVCACPEPTAPTRPAVVLDPFGGTGTTALVAKALGRHGISVDMSADYCRLAQWRTTDEAHLAKAMRVEKPAVQVEGQISMLDLLDEEPA
jgi:DNA modification methylase